jgi:hypothetical protein
MRIILRNADALRLEQALEPNTAPKITFGDSNTVTVTVGDTVVTGRARRTPNAQGSLVIEDMDGRIFVESS